MQDVRPAAFSRKFQVTSKITLELQLVHCQSDHTAKSGLLFTSVA